MFKLILLFTLIWPVIVQARSGQTKPSVTFDSRYLSRGYQQYDTRALPQLGYEITLLRGWILESLTEKTGLGQNVWGRSLYFFSLEIVGAFMMDLSFATAYHELGHASRAAALGLGYQFEDGSKNFFSYYLYKLGNNGGATLRDSRNFTPSESHRFIRGNNSTTYANLLITAGGMNTSTNYASFLADKAKEEGAHTSIFLSYIWSKLNPSLYPENAGGVRFGDVANILDNYRDMKIGDFTEQDIKNGNLISFFASASTWQYLKAASNYISRGEVRTFSDKQTFNWPNFESFFTTHGLSMRTSSAYNHNEQWSFPFGVEHVFRGEHVTEYSVGTKYRFEQIPLKLSANLFAGLSPGTNIELEYSYWEKTLIHTGISVDNLNSLNGERHIVSLKDGEIASSLYIGLTRTL